MENKTLEFKTNLNCGGCVSKVQSDLDKATGIAEWNVDIATNNKVLTVKSKGITQEEIVAIIKSKGFQANPLND
ncbi:MAG: cation transporter [Bacteroidetes bacterium]|nr:cation transporter [Bacteroidota bacterium]